MVQVSLTRVERMWRLANLLHGSRGRTQSQLVDELETSRATLYRDIRVLEDAGVPVAREMVNGEVRFRLLGAKLPELAPPMARVALALACDALGALRGTSLYREIERMKDQVPAPTSGSEKVVVVPPIPAAAEGTLLTVERALRESLRLFVTYQGTHDKLPKARTVLPLSLRLVKGHVYLIAQDEAHDAERTLKLARIASATLGERFDPRHLVVPAMKGAVVVWSGQPTRVAIRVRAVVARFVAEWPLLADQSVVKEDSGDVVVRAEVAGIEEALRWVLGWGRNAEVLEPAELRRRTTEELAGALQSYVATDEMNGSPTGRLRLLRQARATLKASDNAGQSSSSASLNKRGL